MKGIRVQYSCLWVMWAMVGLLLVHNSTAEEEATSCNNAVLALILCGSYHMGEGGADPSPQCCQSAQTLNHMAASVATCHQLCECLKQIGPSFRPQTGMGTAPPSLLQAQAQHLLSHEMMERLLRDYYMKVKTKFRLACYEQQNDWYQIW